ncbi:hypothetical protein L9F63_001525 [Diploptera punctata]|uniref:DBB domain-containing protein n=1 Tax=Diploptera punctata TaxID=6984 RepID=A0AAD8A5S4_DIPPU|nr:hypothetical protein L9F63_001525 [Diploptera punctata]
MDDILIVSSNQSNAADLWVNYLKMCFEHINQSRKKPPFKIMCVGLEDVVGSKVLPYGFEEKMTNVKLQHQPSTKLGRLLQPDRVLAMLLGVDESAVTEQHRAALISYQQWHHLPVKDRDESFVSKFLQEALDMMARVWRQQTLRADKAFFSVIPKKVKEGQNKVIVLLNEPAEKEDKIKISVDKNGELLEISTVKRRNPYTLHFQMPATCMEVSMLVSVHVEKNGQALGFRQVKCESRMRELDQILRSCDNPLNFMCQTLGYSPGDREHLDNFLVQSFQRNIPPHFNLLHPSHSYHHRTHTSPEEYPTLLHFAARHGLEKFAWQLLECPGGEYACEIRNVCELTPAEMAEAAGHSKLANTLRGYMQMTEFTSMYSYLKIMTEGNSKTTAFSEAEYHQPRPLNETYQVPPSARNLMDNYQVPPTARPYIPPEPEIGYMEMLPSAIRNRSPSPVAFRASSEQLNTNASSLEARTAAVPTSSKSESIDQLNLEEEKQSLPGSIKKSREQINQHYGAQEELAEILSDFKNKIISIVEVEVFVDNWRNRHDVRQSFKEKQEQLNQMREEYDKIQQKIKESMKRQTPFDRIRQFFKGKPKESKQTNGSSGSCQDGSGKSSGNEALPVCQRPSSSLSLHSISSSSSSGRMSTVSGCSGASMGDSGTHSDPEDRKMLSSPLDLSKYNFGVKNGIQNYEIPPAPRKYSPPRYTTAPTRQNSTPPPITVSTPVTSIEDRPPWPSPRPDLVESESANENESSKSGSSSNIKSPASRRRTNNGNNSNSNDVQPDEECAADYLDLQDVQEELGGCDYVNVPGSDTIKTPDKEAVHSAITSETMATDESEDLPDYVNVCVPQPETKVPPPVPPRNK